MMLQIQQSILCICYWLRAKIETVFSTKPSNYLVIHFVYHYSFVRLICSQVLVVLLVHGLIVID